MQNHGERQAMAYLKAARRLIEPDGPAVGETSPYILTGGPPLGTLQLIHGGAKASEFEADLIHLEFATGAEANGPVNVMVSMSREPNVVWLRRECRFWLDARGRPFLIATQGRSHATMSFDVKGMDSVPGKPAGQLERGYARAASRLRRLATEALEAGERDAGGTAIAA